MKRSNRAFKKTFPFGRIIPLTRFTQLKPGDVMLFREFPVHDGWVFWMDGKGDLYCDFGTGKAEVGCDHNHWLDDQEFKMFSLKLLAVGVMDVKALRKWEESCK